ncbi:mitochondrial processing peptidase beta, putative [Ichthyophthirius multifiliis]|uniref:Mitochondrial processing peptidase beta, putative n=1 Tax=Ichthyophthirius multifiliis TaxID=5932 RepID=G0QT49_ICHMU|nr:mitochondrial processing peptidase beta, putative [Ichthyophthirius multifiliis]EGR31604.1 mitochondrial processing peptidase beta, putative [Ichthyophthirius multifiliis]|eukprot:XP_004035090.1 mitochondrial processing peptidase beta, putative [Ichthyophthirius multifiliis]
MKLSTSTEWLYFHLWKKNPETQSSCPGVFIPDTVIYRWAQPYYWYFTNRNGQLIRKTKERIENQHLKEEVPALIFKLWKNITPQIYKKLKNNHSWLQLTTKVCEQCYIEYTEGTLESTFIINQSGLLREIKVNRLETLSNGVRVAVEPSTAVGLASVSVCVKAGTRQETLQTSGVCQFLKKLNLRGTQKRSREQIENELSNFGGNLNVKIGRETTVYTLSFQSSQMEQAVDFLGDILQNSVYNKSQIEAEKDAIYHNAVTNQNNQESVILESVHFTSYRDHFMGQPSHGIRENIHNITEEDVIQFHKANYVAENFVIAGAGNLNQEAFLKAVQNSFGNVQKKIIQFLLLILNNLTSHLLWQIFFSIYLYNIFFLKMTMRDDELHNVNIGVFFSAPSWTDPDFFAMHFFQRVLGEYQADKYTGQHLNTSDRQYNLLHKELGNLPDVTLHKCHYLPYSDTGLFGNYLFGNEVFANQMLFLSQMILTEYASYINQAEVFRARAKIFNELLAEQNSADVSSTIASQVTYLNRRIPRSEFARRISNYDQGLLNRAATRWFWDKDIAVVTWGPVHHLMSGSMYNRPIKRSTLGWYGNTQYISH